MWTRRDAESGMSAQIPKDRVPQPGLNNQCMETPALDDKSLCIRTLSDDTSEPSPRPRFRRNFLSYNLLFLVRGVSPSYLRLTIRGFYGPSLVSRRPEASDSLPEWARVMTSILNPELGTSPRDSKSSEVWMLRCTTLWRVLEPLSVFSIVSSPEKSNLKEGPVKQGS